MSQAPPQSKAYRIYAVTVLALIYFFYMMDRSAMVVSQEMIKHEFGLSDSTIGLLTGALYGVAYAIAGIPMGWAADRANRAKLMASVVAIWSGLTALSGLCTNVLQLAFTRVGVGAAESGGGPAAMSIVTDMFPPERRGTVASFLYSGAKVGGIASFIVGGYVAHEYGWRAVFLSFGLPGLLLALLLLLTIKEPPRTGSADGAGKPKASLRETWQVLCTPGLGSIYIATGLTMMAVAGVGTWTLPFVTRAYGLNVKTAGLLLGMGPGVFGVIGGLVVGVLFDWARRFGPRGPLMVVALGCLVYIGGGVMVLLAPNVALAAVGLCVLGTAQAIYSAPTSAAISELAPTAVRGTAFALYSIVANVIGAGIGPILVGALSDRFGGDAHALRMAMMVVLMILLLGAAAYVRASYVFAAETTRRRLALSPA